MCLQPTYMRTRDPRMLNYTVSYAIRERDLTRTTYAVSPRLVINESIGTGVLDLKSIPNISKSFCNATSQFVLLRL